MPKAFIPAGELMIYHHVPLLKKDKAFLQNCIVICVSLLSSMYSPLPHLPPAGCCDAKCQRPPRASPPMHEGFDGWCSFSKLCLRHIRSTSVGLYVFNLMFKLVKMWFEDGWEPSYLCWQVKSGKTVGGVCACVCARVSKQPYKGKKKDFCIQQPGSYQKQTGPKGERKHTRERINKEGKAKVLRK